MEQKNLIVTGAMVLLLGTIFVVLGSYIVTQLPSSGGTSGTFTTAASNLYATANSSGTYTVTYYPIDTGSFTLTNTTSGSVPYNTLTLASGTFKVNASYKSQTDNLGNVTNGSVYNLSKKGWVLLAGSGTALNGTEANINASATFNYTTGTVVFDADHERANVTYQYDQGYANITASYTYQTSTTQSNTSINSQKALTTFANWFPLIALGIGAAVVISLIAGMGWRKNNEGF